MPRPASSGMTTMPRASCGAPAQVNRNARVKHYTLGRARPPVSTLAVLLCTMWMTISPSPCAGQEPGAKLSALLARIQFNGPGKPQDLGPALAALEPADLARLCDLLVEPGAGNDTQARMALSGLVSYVAGSGAREARTKLVLALCAALESSRPTSVKAFLIQQLQLIGDAQAVPTLAKFLPDENLYDSAVPALLSIGGDETTKALRAVLPSAKGARRLALINALGVLRDPAAVPLLRADLDSKDWDLKWAVVAALANLGDEPLLEDMPRAEGDSWYTRCQRNSFFIRLVQRLAEAGHTLVASEVYMMLFESPMRVQNEHEQCAALFGLVEVRGPDAIDQVFAGLGDADPEIRASAMDAALRIAGPRVTAAFIAELRRPESALRASMLRVLEQRGDAAALPAVLEALKDARQDVRRAALSAAVTLGGDAAIPALVGFLNTAPDDERSAARQALLRIVGAPASQKIAEALQSALPRGRAALLEALADRRARDQIEVVFESARHSDPTVRLAAIHALEGLGDERAAAELLEQLRNTKDESERAALERALAATCNRAVEPSARAVQVLAALQPQVEDDYASLLRVLGHIGGADALAAVRTALKDPRAPIRAAAFQALQDWPDPAAAEDVLQIAKATADAKDYVLALRAYARLVSLDAQRPPEQLLEMYRTGLEAARRPDEKKLFLAKLGDVPHARTVDVLAHCLTDPDVKREAAAALVTVADKLLPAGYAAARSAAEQALTATTDENLRQRAAQVLKRVAEFEDFITAWRVAGPYEQREKEGSELLDIAFAPEEPGSPSVEWRPQPPPVDSAEYWYVDLNANQAMVGPHRAAYLRTWVYSNKAQDVLLEVGSDDGLKLWLNGQLVHRNNALRACDRGQDKVKATLKDGWNELRLKVVNAGGGWAASLRIRTPDGGRPEGLRVDANRQE